MNSLSQLTLGRLKRGVDETLSLLTLGRLVLTDGDIKAGGASGGLESDRIKKDDTEILELITIIMSCCD